MDRVARINVGWKAGLLGKASYTVAQSLPYYTTPIFISALAKCQENTHEKIYGASKQLVSEETHYEDILYS